MDFRQNVLLLKDNLINLYFAMHEGGKCLSVIRRLPCISFDGNTQFILENDMIS